MYRTLLSTRNNAFLLIPCLRVNQSCVNSQETALTLVILSESFMEAKHPFENSACEGQLSSAVLKGQRGADFPIPLPLLVYV